MPDARCEDVPSRPDPLLSGDDDGTETRTKAAKRSFGWIATLARARHAALAVGALALLLSSTSLFAGRAADDYIHAAILTGLAAEHLPGFDRSPLDIFRFAVPEANGALQADGVLPWWADPDVRFAFFRPLSALTHWADHVLWPESAVAMHLHSLGWFAFALAAAYALYRALLPARWIAVLALALYALDDARGPTVGWIANRNAVIACAFAMWAVFFHHRSARSGRARWASPLAFAAALLAGEAGVGGAAYLVAYAVFIDTGSRKDRALRLLPHAAIGAVWLVSVRLLGYGVARSGEYLDPLRDFGGYVSALPRRFVALFAAQVNGSWSDWFMTYDMIRPGLSWIVWVLSVLFVLGLLWIARPLLQRRATARFWLAGAALSTLPSVSAFPADRLLMLVGVGVMGFFAEILAACIEPGDPVRLPKFTGGAIVALHLVIAPLSLPIRAAGVASMRGLLEYADASVPAGEDVRDRTVIYVNPPSDAFVCFQPATRLVQGIPRPKTQRWLATGVSALTLHRVDDRTLDVTPEAGFYPAYTERIFRSARYPMRLGEVVRLPGMSVEVTGLTSDERPSSARFVFDRRLEDPSYLWLTYEGDRYEPFEPPPVGASRVLPAVDFEKLSAPKYHPLYRYLASLGRNASPPE